MNSTVAAVRRPCFASATLCRMSELRRLVPIAADETTINDGTTMAATTTITTTSTHHVTPMRDFVPGHLTGTTSVAQVCRNLFGPIDHEENIRFVQQELHKISSDDMLKWNYDFKTDKPLEGKYTWEPTHVAQVPDAYHTLHLQTTAESSALKLVPSTTSSSSRSKVSTQSHAKKSRALKMPSSSVKARRTLSFSSDPEEWIAAEQQSSHSRLSNEGCDRDQDNCSPGACEVLHRVSEDLSKKKADASNETSDANNSNSSNKEGLSSAAAAAASREQQPDNTANKQTSMTDFLKHRKRTLSPSEDASTSSTGQPALKKIKPEQE